MKKKATLCLTLILLALNLARAQDEMLERIAGETVEDEIYLQIKNDQVNYKLDPLAGIRDDDGFLLVKDEKVLLNAKLPKLKLRFGFYNPYRYSVSIQQDVQDDPVNKSGEEFINALSTYLSFITIGTPLEYSETGLEDQAVMNIMSHGGRVALEASETDDVKQYFSTPSIVQWYLWLEQDETGTRCTLSEIKSLIQSIEEIEKRLYHTFYVGEQEGSISSHTSFIISSVYNPTTDKDFQNKLSDAIEFKKEFQKQIEEINKNVLKVEDIEKTLKIEPSSERYCRALNLYTHQVLVQYIAEIKDKYKKLTIMLDNLTAYLNIGSNYLSIHSITSSTGDPAGLSYREELSADHRSLKTITITVKKFDLSTESDDAGTGNNGNIFIKEKTEFKRAFRLVRFRRSWSEASTGLFYSNIGYPSYTTVQDGDKLVVAEPAIRKPRALIALFYNQVFNFQTYPIFPVVQVGLATGKDYPTILAGGGFRLISKDSRRFSITGGIALPFTQELNELVPGVSTVSGQADIDKDIRYRLGVRPGFYLGLAWKL